MAAELQDFVEFTLHIENEIVPVIDRAEEEDIFDDAEFMEEEERPPFDNRNVFVYMGGWNDHVPNNVIRARVDPSVGTIRNGVFNERLQLEEVELCEGLQQIGEDEHYAEVFKECLSLRRVEIPSSVTLIRSGAFLECINLEEVVFNEGLHTIEERAFCSCIESLKRIDLPATIRHIGADAFCYCSSLVSINIPDGVESIGNSAFRECNISTFRIPSSITTIPNNGSNGNGMFSHCKCMFSIEIPEDITRIGQSTFSNCDSLRNVALPSNARTSDDMFDTCKDMKELFFGHQPLLIMALKNRFRNLPVHKMLYYQSFLLQWSISLKH